MIPVLATVAASSLHRRVGQRVGAVGFALAVSGALLLPFLLQSVFPGLDFEYGRYDTARTAVGLLMLVPALAFASLSPVEPERGAIDRVRRWAGLVPVGLAAALAVSVGSAMLFLRDWTAAVHGLQRVVESGSIATSPQFMSYDAVRPLMDADESRANDRIEFQWVLPFRSLVLADGALPTRVDHGESDLTGFCEKLRAIGSDRTAIPASSIKDMADFACRYQAPPAPETIGKKAMATIRRWMAWFF